MISCSAPMRNLSMLTPMVSVFCLFVLLYHITAAFSTNPPYIAVDDIKLDCGGSDGNLKESDEREWIGDSPKYFPREEDNLKSNISEPPKGGTELKAPYTTARISYYQFTYVFPVTLGPKFVRLFFYPASYSHFENSTDFFTVKAGSFTLLRNFSASILVADTNLVKEFCINVEENQKLNLTFIPLSTSSGNFYAFINGIEIVSMPEDLYYRPEGQSPTPIYVSQSPQFYINYSMALEMVFRLNVGGGLISPMDDTGMFREWSPDIDFFYGGSVVHHMPSLTIHFSKIPNYTAPNDVYQSARSMGLNQTKNLRSNLTRVNETYNLHSNLTWGLPVDLGFNYLVRLHFCEIDPNINYSGERRFIINIDHQLAQEDADIIFWTENRDTAFYMDYVVMIQDKGVDEGKKHNLSIDLHPRIEGTFHDAILNGVEVFKLSNKDNNLAGPEMVPFLPSLIANKSKPKKTTFIAIGSGVGFLVVLTSVCCMVLWKLRKTNRWFWRDPYKGKSTRTKASSLPKELCRHFSLDEIKTATFNFHKELIIGRGGFGDVYKGFIDDGFIDDGTMTVAIKRLKPESRQGKREFLTEIEMLSELRHVHLVSLIACGLHYLHRCNTNPIIHRDVKTTNILLDEKWMSKVSDFGLSKMGLDQTPVSTVVKGTIGYLDPDYARRQQVTEKSDVYSFGVVMFEVLCGRKALNSKLDREQWHLATWARKCIEKGAINHIIDPNLKGKIVPECFKVYVQVAESCVRDQGIQRPTMNDVIEQLQFALELQQNADATQEKINPNGEITYHATSADVYCGPLLASNSGIGLTTINCGFTNPSLDFDGVTSTSRDIFMNNSKTKT
uniref:Protein kinase domain-containing protein n=1 Tax=Fagus sylvatica TaxID=28930 RepID=A0A2N9IQI0_FAGSY